MWGRGSVWDCLGLCSHYNVVNGIMVPLSRVYARCGHVGVVAFAISCRDVVQ